MAKKSFWQRGEDYAKKVSDEIIDQIKGGVAPWQKPWKPGESVGAENFSTGKKYTGGNSLYLMSRGHQRGARRQPLGNLQPDQRSGRAGSQGRERNTGSVLHESHGQGREGRAGQDAERQGRQDDLRRRKTLRPNL